MSVFTKSSKRVIETAVVVVDAGMLEGLSLIAFTTCFGRINRKLTKRSTKFLNRTLNSNQKNILSFELQVMKFTEEQAKSFVFCYQTKIECNPERVRSIHWSKTKKDEKSLKGRKVYCKFSDNPKEGIIFDDI